MVFFFFKQKTAYEMRISDWSSDVCSSDLLAARGEVVDQLHVAPFAASAVEEVLEVDEGRVVARQLAQWPATDLAAFGVVGVERDRQVLLAGRHRRRQRQRAKARARQDRRRKDEAQIGRAHV